MALIIALVLILILGCTRLFDNRDKIQFETRMTRKKQWVESVTDDDLERKLTFGLTDTPEVYESELKDAYEEIERKYTQSIQAVYNSFINDAASRGEDKREYWKKEMLMLFLFWNKHWENLTTSWKMLTLNLRLQVVLTLLF